MKLQFYLRYHTSYGQSLWISGDTDELGNGDPAKALPMNYLNDEFWTATLEIKRKNLSRHITYKYLLKNTDGGWIYEWGQDRYLEGLKKTEIQDLQLVDTWNHAGEYENAFYTAPFVKVLL